MIDSSPAGPRRGEIWLADLDATRGREQAGRRPVLVLSVDGFNMGPADLVIIAPLTTKLRGIRSHVEVDPPEGGVRKPSAVLCEAVRSISKHRLVQPWGTLEGRTIERIEDCLRILLGL